MWNLWEVKIVQHTFGSRRWYWYFGPLWRCIGDEGVCINLGRGKCRARELYDRCRDWRREIRIDWTAGCKAVCLGEKHWQMLEATHEVDVGWGFGCSEASSSWKTVSRAGVWHGFKTYEPTPGNRATFRVYKTVKRIQEQGIWVCARYKSCVVCVDDEWDRRYTAFCILWYWEHDKA